MADEQVILQLSLEEAGDLEDALIVLRGLSEDEQDVQYPETLEDVYRKLEIQLDSLED